MYLIIIIKGQPYQGSRSQRFTEKAIYYNSKNNAFNYLPSLPYSCSIFYLLLYFFLYISDQIIKRTENVHPELRDVASIFPFPLYPLIAALSQHCLFSISSPYLPTQSLSTTPPSSLQSLKYLKGSRRHDTFTHALARTESQPPEQRLLRSFSPSQTQGLLTPHF